ncbi:PREDICTED: IQ domain-containing protein D-like [Priapulus caudatus]|uniref:Dynein regulatory complex protein 10 n=1 Tax=Priapulus caudatus TaxID=37621 RepID=A0ABM1EMU1_PRICU|nr:PREDICTED: IQ domain-containing protein D-like [Priapulus caudatus]
MASGDIDVQGRPTHDDIVNDNVIDNDNTFSQSFTLPNPAADDARDDSDKNLVTLFNQALSVPKPQTTTVLDPARKKLTSVEAQRVLAVVDDTIHKMALVSLFPHVLRNLDRLADPLGDELAEAFSQYRVLRELHDEIFEARSSDSDDETDLAGEQASALTGAEVGATRRIAEQRRDIEAKLARLCKVILRLFAANPAATEAVRAEAAAATVAVTTFIEQLRRLRAMALERLLTSPIEERESVALHRELSQRIQKNEVTMAKLEAELEVLQSDKASEVKKRNDIVRKLQADLNRIKMMAEDFVKRTRAEAHSQEVGDQRNSELKLEQLVQQLQQLASQLAETRQQHRDSELSLRKRKFKIETELENWLQKYDQDMGDRQFTYERIYGEYREESDQLMELEDRYDVLETQHRAIVEERRIEAEDRERRAREMALNARAAIIIQAYWKSFKVRKMLRAKSKKKGKGGGKKKGKK